MSCEYEIFRGGRAVVDERILCSRLAQQFRVTHPGIRVWNWNKGAGGCDSLASSAFACGSRKIGALISMVCRPRHKRASKHSARASAASSRPEMTPAARSSYSSCIDSATLSSPLIMQQDNCQHKALPAGFSLPVQQPDQSNEHTWVPLGAGAFRVRCGPDYKKFGRKESSRPALGDVCAMDCVRSKRKMVHIMQYNLIELPSPTLDWSETYPEFLVVNQMLPVHFRQLPFTTESTDGETYNVITFVRLPPGLGKDWDGTTEPKGAEELLKRFLLNADVDPSIAHGLKEIGVVRNLEEVGRRFSRPIFNLMAKFNGKPILTRPEHKFFRDLHNRYFEIDLDAHRYSLATRGAVAAVLKHIGLIEMDYGLVIEARTEDQMPETMCFSCTIMRLQKDRVPDFPPPNDFEPSDGVNNGVASVASFTS